VPKNYQGNLPNCIIALELAQRIGASPLMVMQNLYIVHGRPAWSSQFLIAAVNQCGRFTALQYEWTGKRQHRRMDVPRLGEGQGDRRARPGPGGVDRDGEERGLVRRRTARSGRPCPS
jgi:hypothetical protein